MSEYEFICFCQTSLNWWGGVGLRGAPYGATKGIWNHSDFHTYIFFCNSDILSLNVNGLYTAPPPHFFKKKKKTSKWPPPFARTKCVLLCSGLKKGILKWNPWIKRNTSPPDGTALKSPAARLTQCTVNYSTQTWSRVHHAGDTNVSVYAFMHVNKTVEMGGRGSPLFSLATLSPSGKAGNVKFYRHWIHRRHLLNYSTSFP